MNGATKAMLILFLIIYVFSPLDAFPGPVDDLFVAMLAISALKN